MGGRHSAENLFRSGKVETPTNFMHSRSLHQSTFLFLSHEISFKKQTLSDPRSGELLEERRSRNPAFYSCTGSVMPREMLHKCIWSGTKSQIWAKFLAHGRKDAKPSTWVFTLLCQPLPTP